MQVQEMLKNYKKSKSKIAAAQLEIEQLEALLTQPQQYDIESMNDTIEALALPASALSCMPKSVTHKFNSSTENVVFSYLSEWKREPPKRSEIRNRIGEIRDRIYQLELQVELIDRVLLPALSDKQNYIIHRLYFRGCSWREIQQTYEQDFEYRELKTLKRIRNSALMQMDEMIVEIGKRTL